MFNLRQLRYFAAVAEHEHVGRAAQVLNITQSPLSRQISDLEARLGLELFHRSKKRLKLTSTGREFLKEATALLAHADRLDRRVEALSKGQTGTILIGYVDGAVHAGVISSALKSNNIDLGSINLKLSPMRSGEQFRKLRLGELDIGLSYSPPMGLDLFLSRKVHTEKFLLAVPASFGWQGRVSVAQLDQKRFISLPVAEYPDAISELLNDCHQAGFKPDFALEATSPLAALDLVSAGLGLAIIQESLASLLVRDVVFLPLPKAFKRCVEIFITYRENPAPHERVLLNAIFMNQRDQIL